MKQSAFLVWLMTLVSLPPIRPSVPPAPPEPPVGPWHHRPEELRPRTASAARWHWRQRGFCEDHKTGQKQGTSRELIEEWCTWIHTWQAPLRSFEDGYWEAKIIIYYYLVPWMLKARKQQHFRDFLVVCSPMNANMIASSVFFVCIFNISTLGKSCYQSFVH